MAVTWPVELDPQEQLWMPVDWAPVWADGAAETINTSTFEASSQAVLDGHSAIADEVAATATNIKLTGGVLGTDYTWLHTVTTTDTNSKTRKRQRSCICQVREK